jgi:hypothetical protein
VNSYISPSRRQNGKDIEGKCPPQAVILPARVVCFEIEAILASSDLIHFVHCRVGKARLRTTKPAPCRLALNKMASNRKGEIYEFTASIRQPELMLNLIGV